MLDELDLESKFIENNFANNNYADSVRFPKSLVLLFEVFK